MDNRSVCGRSSEGKARVKCVVIGTKRALVLALCGNSVPTVKMTVMASLKVVHGLSRSRLLYICYSRTKLPHLALSMLLNTQYVCPLACLVLRLWLTRDNPPYLKAAGRHPSDSTVPQAALFTHSKQLLIYSSHPIWRPGVSKQTRMSLGQAAASYGASVS